MSQEPQDFLESLGGARFGGRYLPRKVARPSFAGTAAVVSIIAAAALLGIVYAARQTLFTLPKPTPEQAEQEKWTSGPKTYPEALATFNGEMDYLGRLRLSRLAIERGEMLDYGDRAIFKLYQDDKREYARAGFRPPPSETQKRIENEIVAQLADIDAKIKVQETKVERARQRKEALDR
jgi:hypothetical protein